MYKNFHHKINRISLSLVACLCLTGCSSSDSQPTIDHAEDNSIVSTVESQITESNTTTDEAPALESTVTAEATPLETSVEETTTEATDSYPIATIIAYTTDIEDTVWYEGALDIRFPEANTPSASWNQTLPIPLWGESDVIALVPAPLSLENIQNAGYSAVTEDGSTAAFLSNGSAESYIIGYMSQDGTHLDYTVADLDIATLLGSDTPTLQQVLNTLGTPAFGFAYENLEARYYYLFDSYYIEVSMAKADATQATWSVLEILYYDSSAFLNHDIEQEINSVKKSGINGFSSEYLAPTGF